MYKAYYEQECGEGSKINTSGWMHFRCPFPNHDDENPSFGVNLFDKGRYKCLSCPRTGGDIFKFHMERHGTDFPETLKILAQFAGVPTDTQGNPRKNPKPPKKKYGKVTKVYQYKDLSDKIIHETCRTENPKNFFQQRPDPQNPKKRIPNLNGVTTILYNLKKVVESDTIYIVEGERDVDTLQKIGLVGTCNAQGADKWPDHLSEWLKDKNIIILPDNDEPGKNHAQTVSNKLYDKSKSIKIVNLPGLKKGGDVSDWLALGNTRETLLELVENTKPYQDHIDFLNKHHAAMMMNGQFSVFNIGPTVTFSRTRDFYDQYLNRRIPNPQAGKRGQSKTISIAVDWMKSGRRREYKGGIVFAPGEDPTDAYNLYRGLALEPQKGDTQIFHDHSRNIICSGDDALYTWVMDWTAHLIQHPGGNRPGTAIVMKGKQGVGKGAFVQPFDKILGQHFKHVTGQEQFTGRFNSHLKDGLLVFVDEGYWAGSKQSEGKLKALITEDTILLEAKFRDPIFIKNHMRLIMASNSEWVVPAGLEERRMAVLDVSEDRRGDKQYFKRFFKWINGTGSPALLYEFLNREITSDLRTIPRTAALLDQILQSLDSVESFWVSRLYEGVIGENGSWPEHIRTATAYSEYQSFCNDTRERHSVADNVFTKRLRKLAPDIGITRKYYDGNRHKSLELPYLDDCRKGFEELVGMEINWDEESGPF